MTRRNKRAEAHKRKHLAFLNDEKKKRAEAYKRKHLAFLNDEKKKRPCSYLNFSVIKSLIEDDVEVYLHNLEKENSYTKGASLAHLALLPFTPKKQGAKDSLYINYH